MTHDDPNIFSSPNVTDIFEDFEGGNSRQYRKRPVVIEAVRWTGKNVLELYSFMHGKPNIGTDYVRDRWDDFCVMHENESWHITTLEDGPNGEAKHVASVGDWVIRGIKGEFYPCKPDIFEATYEPAHSKAPSPENPS